MKRFWPALILLSAALFLLAACSDSRANRLLARADRLAHEEDYAEAIVVLETLRARHPDTRAGQQAEKRIVLYRGLLEARGKEKRRRAKDDLVELGRRLLHYREMHGRYPESLAGLSAETSASADPWGRPYRYRSLEKGSRYRLGCLGEDGESGGTGDAQDLLVQSGVFTENLPWVDQ